jgi:hypothetical protein
MRVTAVKDAPNPQGQDSQIKPEPPGFDVVEVKLHALANKAGSTGREQVNDPRGETDLPMAHDYRLRTRIPADSPLLRGPKAVFSNSGMSLNSVGLVVESSDGFGSTVDGLEEP